MTKHYLLHGAGAGHQSAFLQAFKMQFEQVSGQTLEPITLSYMQQIESTGKRRPPPSIYKLVTEIQANIDPQEPIVLIGKSMGCRIAAELCASHNVTACVALGFPFHPTKRPEKHRLHHLEASRPVPYLVLQGTRDALGGYDWVTQQSLPSNICVQWIDGADHDFHVLKRYQRSFDSVMQELTAASHDFIQSHLDRKESKG